MDIKKLVLEELDKECSRRLNMIKTAQGVLDIGDMIGMTGNEKQENLRRRVLHHNRVGALCLFVLSMLSEPPKPKPSVYANPMRPGDLLGDLFPAKREPYFQPFKFTGLDLGDASFPPRPIFPFPELRFKVDMLPRVEAERVDQTLSLPEACDDDECEACDDAEQESEEASDDTVDASPIAVEIARQPLIVPPPETMHGAEVTPEPTGWTEPDHYSAPSAVGPRD